MAGSAPHSEALEEIVNHGVQRLLLTALGSLLLDWLEAALHTWRTVTVAGTVPSDRKSRSRVPRGREAADLKGASAVALVQPGPLGKRSKKSQGLHTLVALEVAEGWWSGNRPACGPEGAEEDSLLRDASGLQVTRCTRLARLFVTERKGPRPGALRQFV